MSLSAPLSKIFCLRLIQLAAGGQRGDGRSAVLGVGRLLPLHAATSVEPGCDKKALVAPPKRSHERFTKTYLIAELIPPSGRYGR